MPEAASREDWPVSKLAGEEVCFQVLSPEQAATMGLTQSGTTGTKWVPIAVVWAREGHEDHAKDRLQKMQEENVVLDEVKAMRRELAATRRDLREPHWSAPANASEARRVLGLARKLRREPGKEKAPLGKVFDCIVLDGVSQRETAHRCSCAPSLVSARVASLEREFRMTLKQLRALALMDLEMETTVKGDRPRRRRHGARAAGGQGWESVAESPGEEPEF